MPQKASDRREPIGLTVSQLLLMFPDEAASRKWLEDIRWAEGGRHCPHCGSFKTAPVPNERPMPYHCGECREYFSVKTGTVMQSSKVALQKWVVAMYLMSTSLKGVSSMKLHRDLGVTPKTAWLLAQKIRQGWIEGGCKLTGQVEVDETYIGGKERNKHANMRLKPGRGAVSDGEIRACVIDKIESTTFMGLVVENVETGSDIFAHEHSCSRGSSPSFTPCSVKHRVGEYGNGMTHNNGIDRFWAMLKRGYKSTCRQMSVKSVRRCSTEFADRQGSDCMRLRHNDLVTNHGQ